MRMMLLHLICGLWLLSPTFAQTEPPAGSPLAPVQVECSRLVVKFRPPRPVYPLLARIANIQGTVGVRLMVGTMGRVERAQALDGPTLLRPTAEALCRMWVFEPVLVDGARANVQCEIRVPFRLSDTDPRPGDRPFRAVVELALPSSPGAVTVDEALIREEIREWLGTVGVTPVETADADPGTILHLRVEVQASCTEDGLDLCFLKERCSLWEDRNLADNDPGKPQRIGYISHFVGQKGGGGVQDLVRSALRRSLHEFLEAFPPLYTPEKAAKATKLTPAIRSAMDFDFSQIKVKHQPPVPGYPIAAKVRRIQGTVVVALTIDPTGRPVLADALSGPYELLQTAIRYALTWEFEPAKLNGVPQYARFRLTMPFRLR